MLTVENYGLIGKKQSFVVIKMWKWKFHGLAASVQIILPFFLSTGFGYSCSESEAPICPVPMPQKHQNLPSELHRVLWLAGDGSLPGLLASIYRVKHFDFHYQASLFCKIISRPNVFSLSYLAIKWYTSQRRTIKCFVFI